MARKIIPDAGSRKPRASAPVQPQSEQRAPVPIYGRTGWELTTGGGLYGTGPESTPRQLVSDIVNLMQSGVAVMELEPDLADAQYGALYLFRLALYAAAAVGDALDGAPA